MGLCVSGVGGCGLLVQVSKDVTSLVPQKWSEVVLKHLETIKIKLIIILIFGTAITSVLVTRFQ